MQIAHPSLQSSKRLSFRQFVHGSTVSLLLRVDSQNESSARWRAYAKRQAERVGWVGAEWQALDAIVTPESGWNPCRHYPSTTDCFYAGSNSCGIPQRNPCPQAWRGRLGASGREQIRELLRYVRDRYGSPSRALAFRRVMGWY